MSELRDTLSRAETVVLKVGTAVLTGGGRELDRAFMHDLAAQVAAIAESGRRVILVSSGAIGAGDGALGPARAPADLSALQAAAAIGQPLLMDRWAEAFRVRARPIAQILVGRADFDARDRFLNIRNCLHALLDRGAVPIVNENDSVATEEISLGDNDVLGAKLAAAIPADAFVILTTAAGVEDASGAVVPETDDPESLAALVRTERSAQGRGGMGTKVEAASIAARAGVPVVIGPGRPPASVARILAGEPVGTAVAPAGPGRGARRHWIALTATPSGVLVVDDGAGRALTERGASLLAKGVVGVEGRFGRGDVVAVRDGAGAEIARGLVNLDSEEARAVLGRPSSEFEAVLGRRTHDELVHRDNLVLTGGAG